MKLSWEKQPGGQQWKLITPNTEWLMATQGSQFLVYVLKPEVVSIGTFNSMDDAMAHVKALFEEIGQQVDD